MNKMSVSFLVGFAALGFAGAAVADDAAKAGAGAGGINNVLSSSSSVTLSRMGQSAVKLNAGTSDLSGAAAALGSSNAMKGALGTGESATSAKIGAVPAGGRPGTNPNFANALSNVGSANALRSNDTRPTEAAPTSNAIAVIGLGGGNLGEALGSQRVESSQRIGGK